MDDVRAWAQRPLEDVYPVVFLDCLVLKIREGGSMQRRACYLALGVTVDVLGMCFQETEGAKFWMRSCSSEESAIASDTPPSSPSRTSRAPDQALGTA
jgi:putative transposase